MSLLRCDFYFLAVCVIFLCSFDPKARVLKKQPMNPFSDSRLCGYTIKYSIRIFCVVSALQKCRVMMVILCCEARTRPIQVMATTFSLSIKTMILSDIYYSNTKNFSYLFQSLLSISLLKRSYNIASLCFNLVYCMGNCRV